MDDYHFQADVMNKFSQLTPWIQLFITLCFASIIGQFIYAFMRVTETLLNSWSRTEKRD